MRPSPLAFRWSQFQRPALSSTGPSRRVRTFHSTRPAPFVAELITAATGFLHGIHGISGLPWAASIPLTAVIVRTSIALPLLIFTRIHARKSGDITPLLYVNRKKIGEAIKQRNKATNTYMRPDQAEKQLRKELQQKTKYLRDRYRINRYAPFAPMLQIPIWLSLMEGIRNLCGVNLGLFRYLLPLPDKEGHAVDLPGVEQSLATEGAYWFPDLLAGDPTGYLPILLGLSIIVNVRSGWKTKTLAEASDYSGPVMTRLLFAKSLKELLSAAGIYIACTAYVTGMPAGMMLYWIASTNTATLHARFLDKFLFKSKPVEALGPMHVRLLRPGDKPPPVKSL